MTNSSWSTDIDPAGAASASAATGGRGFAGSHRLTPSYQRQHRKGSATAFTDRRTETLYRIKAQTAILDQLTPGTREHRIADKVLGLLNDCLRVMQDVAAYNEEVRRAKWANHMP